jgi:pimeloyl-ACP methyl ester carboxylesterase
MTAQLNYHLSGEGLSFIFQHGLTSNLEQVQGLLAGIKGIKLLSVDCPGHGASPLPKRVKPSFNFYVDQIINLMDELKVENAIWGGISMGSGIAMNATLRYPERVIGLVLIRPAWLDRGSPESLEILQDAAKSILKKDKKAFTDQDDFLKILDILPKAADSILGVFESHQRPELPLVIENMVRDAPFDQINSLDNIDIPSLVIGSEDDPLHPFFMAEKIDQHLQNSKLVKIVSRYIDDEQHRSEVIKLATSFIKMYEN